MKIKKYLNGNEFIKDLRSFFEKLPEHRDLYQIPMVDIVSSALAILQLKYESLLQFEKKNRASGQSNLNRVFQIRQIPSDTRMREVLDMLPTNNLKPAFKVIFKRLQEAKILEKFKYIEDYVLASADGTQVFSSKKIHCDHCIEKYHKSSKETSYSHQILAASIVHPELKSVIPLCPEMIAKEDGFAKNDCELNASKRLWNQFRKEHPIKAIALEDSLSANAPYIDHLRMLDIRYIITAKQGNCSTLFKNVEKRKATLQDVYTHTTHRQYGLKIIKQVSTTYEYVNDVPLHYKEGAPSVNFLSMKEITSWEDKKGHL